MKVGTGVELEPESLFRLTVVAYFPDLMDLMKADDKEKFEAVSANAENPKKKVRCFALLTPFLAQAVHDSEMSPAVIFTKILDCIKIGAVIPTGTATTVK